jgi:hypothetical protein
MQELPQHVAKKIEQIGSALSQLYAIALMNLTNNENQELFFDENGKMKYDIPIFSIIWFLFKVLNAAEDATENLSKEKLWRNIKTIVDDFVDNKIH